MAELKDSTINGNPVWHAGNDGTGSGLDADTLDGLHASSFYSSSNPPPNLIPAFTKYTYNVGSNITSISGADANSNTLSYTTDGNTQLEVFVNGVKLAAGASNDYTATNGTSISFTYTVLAGSVIDIQVFSLVSAAALSQWTTSGNNIFYNTGNVGIGGTPTVSLDVGGRTDAIRVPVGTSAQRPVSASAGSIRYNTTITEPEWFNGTTWFKFSTSGGAGLSAENPATSPTSLYNSGAGITTAGFYWFLGPGMSAPRQLYYRPNYFDSRSWVRVFSSPFAGTATVNEVGYSIPWKGFFLQRDTEDFRGTGYFTTYQTFNTRSDTATATSGTFSGYRIFIGQAGGHGFYNTSQSPCSWANSGGALGAGYDGSCGTWPNALRWGTGNSGTPNYSMVGGTWETYIWWD
jgi:hypothetical protein